MSHRSSRVWGIVGASLFVACGGSSSETPFPLEPELNQARPGPRPGARYVVIDGRPNDKSIDKSKSEGEEVDAQAPSTWGSSEGSRE